MPFLNGEDMREKLQEHLQRIQPEHQVAEQIATLGAPTVEQEDVEKK